MAIYNSSVREILREIGEFMELVWKSISIYDIIYN